jgi:DnaJ domain
MPVDDYPGKEIRHAYQVLGVSHDATANSIKRAHRALIKRWHPDLYRGGTPAHAEATQMARLINEAYLIIAQAPLRYRDAPYPHPAEARSRQSTSPWTSGRTTGATDSIPKIDRLEFWVRFVCGGLFGISVCADIADSTTVGDFHYSAALVLGALSIIVGCGFAAARLGDRFWHSIVRRWWLWW